MVRQRAETPEPRISILRVLTSWWKLCRTTITQHPLIFSFPVWGSVKPLCHCFTIQPLAHGIQEFWVMSNTAAPYRLHLQLLHRAVQIPRQPWWRQQSPWNNGWLRCFHSLCLWDSQDRNYFSAFTARDSQLYSGHVVGTVYSSLMTFYWLFNQKCLTCSDLKHGFSSNTSLLQHQ